MSEYAQGLLSGLSHPLDLSDSNDKVLIESIEPTNAHRLLWQQDGSDTTDAAKSEVHLSTAELFDLTEAIDQFLADGLTLPNFVLPLTPLSRRYCVPEQSLSERVTPPLIGISGFALTAFALFFMPVPEKAPSVEGEAIDGSGGIEQTTETTEESAPSASPTSEVSAAELDELVAAVPKVEDGLSIALLQTYLYRTLDSAWTERALEPPAAYRLSIATDGSIVGYQSIEGTSEEVANSTPLPQLTFTPVDQRSPVMIQWVNFGWSLMVMSFR